MSDFELSKLFSTKSSTLKTVEACGMTFDVFVRRLPAVDLRKFFFEQQHDDMQVRSEAGFEALAKSIRKEDGAAFATKDDYRKMDSEAIAALLRAFTEVNTQKVEELGND